MKREGEMLVVACKQMAGVSPESASSLTAQQLFPTPSPLLFPTPSPLLFPTPSPFSLSVASRRHSSRPSLHLSTLLLRFTVLVFSFVSTVSLATPSSRQNGVRDQPSSFTHYSQLMFCFIVSILVFLYSAFQVFKGVCDITHRGILISDMISDYLSFILDQLGVYLLISSCSVGILTIQQIGKSAPLWKATVISSSMSLATFFVLAVCSLLSGYKLCKRII